MLFRPFRDELKLMGTSSTYEEEYNLFCEQITEVRQRFQKTPHGLEEAMKAVAEEIVDEQLDEIAPAARQSEEDANMAKEDQGSLLLPPDDRLAEYDVGLDIGGSTDKREVTIPNRLADDEYLQLASSLNPEQRKFFYEIQKLTQNLIVPFYQEEQVWVKVMC